VLVFSAYRASVRDIGPIGPGGFRRCFRASAGVIVLTSGAVIAARYALSARSAPSGSHALW
jgi:hypothetical protein